MKLIDYLRQFGAQQLAQEIGTSPAYLSQLAHGHRQASPKMAKKIEEATDSQVTISDLRPDLSALFEIEKTAS